MNIPLPRFTFLMGPTTNFLEELRKTEPTAIVENAAVWLYEAAMELCLEGKEADFERVIRGVRADFVGQMLLRNYKRHASEMQMIYTGILNKADVTPIATEYGARNCLIIRLGALLPAEEPNGLVNTVWLPPMDVIHQLKLLERELTKQIEPIEASHDQRNHHG